MTRRYQVVVGSLADVLAVFRSSEMLVAGHSGSLRVGFERQEDPSPHAPELVLHLVGEGKERGRLRLKLDGSWRLEVPMAGPG